MSALADQIGDLLADRATLLGSLIGDPETASRWVTHAREQAERIADRLEAWDDPREIAGLLRNLAVLEHGDDAGIPAEWWRTPIGRMMARSVAGDPGIAAETLPAITAGELLGVTRTQIYRLLDEGRLDRHPDGGVTRASVMARLARQR